jgi:hypothetical protein
MQEGQPFTFTEKLTLYALVILFIPVCLAIGYKTRAMN